jgi:ribosomal protein L32
LQKRLTAEYNEVKDMVSQIKRSNRRKEDEQLDVDAATNPRNPKDLTCGRLPRTHHTHNFG